MMRKGDAKAAFEQMFSEWQSEEGIMVPLKDNVSFSKFCSWVEKKHYSLYFNFRSVAGSRNDVEKWFDQHFKQTWRN
jgi:hypothetical protein